MFLYWVFIRANVSPGFLLRTENQFAVGLDAFLLQRSAKKLPKSIRTLLFPNRPEMNPLDKMNLADYPSHSFLPWMVLHIVVSYQADRSEAASSDHKDCGIKYQ